MMWEVGKSRKKRRKNTDVHESTITDVLTDVLTVEYSSILTNTDSRLDSSEKEP